MSDLYSITEVRERAEKLVRDEVYTCASQLVSAVSSGDNCATMGLSYEDDLMPLLESLDYDEPADDHIRNGMGDDERREYLAAQSAEVPEGADEAAILALTFTTMEEQGAQEFCDEFNLDPDRNEIFEHWVVSDWLARRLEERDESVCHDFLGLTIWGRATTGQHISLDGVVLRIAAELVGVTP
jgi:hypothetical protein